MVNKRIISLDFLKAASILAVLVWHLKALDLLPLSEGFKNVLYYNLSLLAVPVFFIVSFLLLAKKIEENKGYIKTRLQRLTKIYLFWFIVGSLFTLSVVFYKYGSSFSSHLPRLFSLLITGGHLSFFFITSLLILSAVLGFFAPRLKKLNKKLLTLMAFVISLFFSLLAAVGYLSGMEFVNDTANFLNYLPFVFIALGLAKDARKINKLFILVIIIFIAISLFFEYSVLRPDIASAGYPYYSRLSIYLSAWLISYLTVRFPFKRDSLLVRFLSRYTLGIYAIHVLTIDVATGFLTRAGYLGTKFLFLRVVSVVFSTLLILLLAKQSRLLRRFIQ